MKILRESEKNVQWALHCCCLAVWEDGCSAPMPSAHSTCSALRRISSVLLHSGSINDWWKYHAPASLCAIARALVVTASATSCTPGKEAHRRDSYTLLPARPSLLSGLLQMMTSLESETIPSPWNHLSYSYCWRWRQFLCWYSVYGDTRRKPTAASGVNHPTS